MRNPYLIILLAAGISLGSWLDAQPASHPHVGYLFPAGAQVGTTVEMTAGGRGLRGIKQVYVTGDGVEAVFVQHIPGAWSKYRNHMRDVSRSHSKNQKNRNGKEQPKLLEEPVNHPKFNFLEELNESEFRQVAHKFYSKEIKQRNREIEEMAVIRVTVAPDATTGMREIRFLTNLGMSNPVLFEVGALPDVYEREPNDRSAHPSSFAKPPFVLNGQVMPGDEDRFRFLAEEGQQIVLEVHARKLVPYLADAVPGWFQATVSLYNEQGDEIAYADDYHFKPDPVLCYKIPKSGNYELSIRDAIYRGREDFVYRILVGEFPYVTYIYPMGGTKDQDTVVEIAGWNLALNSISLDTQLPGNTIQEGTLKHGSWKSNAIPYAVDTLPEFVETEGTSSDPAPHKLQLPIIINGRIDQAGDVDVYHFHGKAGETIQAEVLARRLLSPMDALCRLMDTEGKVLAWNDDFNQGPHKDLLTHHSDSKLTYTLPRNGDYSIQISDAQSHGSKAHAYRLYLRHPKPDFEVRITPSGLSIPVGRSAPITVHVLRKNGFDGPVDIEFPKQLSAFKLSGASVPAGVDRIQMTVAATPRSLVRPVPLLLYGKATIKDQKIYRKVIPCEDTTQAFITHHLVKTQSSYLMVTGNRFGGTHVTRTSKDPIEVPAGGKKLIRLSKPRTSANSKIELLLNAPPPGISIEDIRINNTVITFNIVADNEVQLGLQDNLIVSILGEVTRGQRKRRLALGTLPAIPFKIVKADHSTS